MPCYNPLPGWEQALALRMREFRNLIQDLAPDAGLVVVNDGSTRHAGPENFAALQSALPSAIVVSYPANRGKGYALREGVRQTDADFYLVTDADFPYTLESMRSVVECLLKEGGIAAGNRDTAYYAHVPMFRRWISKTLRWMMRHVLRQPISDSQCGLKGFDRSGKALFLKTSIDRFLFDLEFLMLAKERVKVTPVPVALRSGVVFSKVGWKVLTTEGQNFLTLLFRNALR